MDRIQLIRFVRRHQRAAIIWAAVPLMIFNGGTLIGCGCDGHFESACHCGCCRDMSGGPCCTRGGFDHRNCSCGQQAEMVNQCKPVGDDAIPSAPHHLQGNHCTSIAVYDVVPGVVAHSTVAGDLEFLAFAAADFSLPPTVSLSTSARSVDFDTGRLPADLVVVLHRLVI